MSDPIPAAIRWDLGRDRHQRPVSLAWDAASKTFELKVEAGSQRDETQILRGLTADMLAAASAAAATVKWR